MFVCDDFRRVLLFKVWAQDFMPTWLPSLLVASSGGHDVCDGLTYEDRGGKLREVFAASVLHICLMVQAQILHHYQGSFGLKIDTFPETNDARFAPERNMDGSEGPRPCPPFGASKRPIYRGELLLRFRECVFVQHLVAPTWLGYCRPRHNREIPGVLPGKKLCRVLSRIWVPSMHRSTLKPLLKLWTRRGGLDKLVGKVVGKVVCFWSRWWQLKYFFIFIPILGEMIQFDS